MERDGFRQALWQVDRQEAILVFSCHLIDVNRNRQLDITFELAKGDLHAVEGAVFMRFSPLPADDDPLLIDVDGEVAFLHAGYFDAYDKSVGSFDQVGGWAPAMRFHIHLPADDVGRQEFGVFRIDRNKTNGGSLNVAVHFTLQKTHISV